MASLETTYMGLKLKNPIIVGSSGLTNSVENVMEIAKEGAGAVVLKSLFEEQINQVANQTFDQGDISNFYPEAQDYIQNYSTENDVTIYLDLISQCKAKVDIPIIASINCMSDNSWVNFAKKIEDAGADALELNIFVLPSDPNKSSADNEKVYFDIIEKVSGIISIPIAIKLSYYFSGLAKTMEMLSWTKIKSLVLFNRFFSPDIDINSFEIKSSNVFSTPADLSQSLRWVAMLSDKIDCEIASSTGVHNGEAAIKQLLAGAKVVQIASVLYKKGIKEISSILNDMESWMNEKKFKTIDDFRGRMCVKHSENSASYERVQFMKYFSGIE
jgi:dihydroorotate dehydrogenase (fumarate)